MKAGWPKLTGAAEIAAITELVAPWLHVADARPSHRMAIDLPGGPYEFDTLVMPAEQIASTAREARAALLARAEDALAALEAAGWYAAGYPAMWFDGHLTLMVVTVAGELVTPPVQDQISLRMEFKVMRL